MILNLVKNAIEAMHEAPSGVLRIRASLSKPYLVHVSVEDTGAGIDPASREQYLQGAVHDQVEAAWGWVFPSADRSSTAIMAGSGYRPGPSAAAVFHFELPTTVAEY